MKSRFVPRIIVAMKHRNTAITVFVIVWSLFFFYQTFRARILAPWAKQVFQVELLKIPLLFPPAGWIMFYRVDPNYGRAEVYGVNGETLETIDPHDILETQALGYDNIHRNVLVGALYRDRANAFCKFLDRKFPNYESFMVIYARYPDLLNKPDEIQKQVAYRCP